MSLRSAKHHDLLVARQRDRERTGDLWTVTWLPQGTSVVTPDGQDWQAPRRLNQRERVYNAIWQAEPVGITRKDLADHLHLSENTIRPRVKELEQAGYVHDVGTSVKDGCARIRVLRSPYNHHDCTTRLKAIRLSKEARREP